MPYLALDLRVWLGASFMIHARPKLGKGDDSNNTVDQGNGDTGRRHLRCCLELFGGIFLIVGLIVSIVALVCDRDVGKLDYKEDKDERRVYRGREGILRDRHPALYRALSLALIALGAGEFSLDGLIGL